LIQRFGRVNRKRQKGICPCVVFKLNNENDFFIYNREVVEKTIAALEKITISREGIIDESLLQQFIDEVYPAWNKKDKEQFDEQYKYLTNALQLLSPMCNNKYTEDDFYKQFDGIKILPQVNRLAFENHLNNLDFINAESQQVQISKRRYINWKQNGFLKSDITVFTKNNKTTEQRYLVTNKKYDEKLGLIADEEDPWNTAEIL
jgi:CRISPR-associated endonuclease/helicase Cas3